MSSNRRSVHSRRLFVLCAAALCVTPSIVSAEGLSFDLRIHGTGAKDAVVTSVGQVVQLDLFAYVTGNNSDPTDDGLDITFGSVLSSSGGLLGNLSTTGPAYPFNQSGSDPGTTQDLDGDGDLDIGGTNPSKATGYFCVRSNPPQMMSASGAGLYLGSFRFTNSTLAGSTQVNWAVRPTTGISAALVWFDGVDQNLFGTGSLISVGTPVSIEAGTIVDPGNTQYLSGNIADHLVIRGPIKPDPAGAPLVIQTGLDLAAGGSLDTSNGIGGYLPSAVYVEDQTSGNAGGSMYVDGMAIGNGGAGVFNQSDGSSSVHTLTIGAQIGSSGTLNVTGGSFNAGDATIGQAGNATLNVNGGIATLNNVNVAATTGSVGTIHADGGALELTGELHLGEGGTAHFEQESGSTSATALYFGDGAPSSPAATAVIDGGTLIAGASYIAFTSPASVQQNGGEVDVAALLLGNYAAEMSTSMYTLTNGTIHGSVVGVGNPTTGTGRFVQSGGLVATSEVGVGNPASEYDLEGGQINTRSESIKGPFVQSGGVNTTGQLFIDGGGNYALAGGHLEVTNYLKLYDTLDFAGTGVFQADSGTAIDLTGGQMLHTSQGTVVGQAGSLMSFPVGFDPYTQFGSFTTQGLVHTDGQPLSIPPEKMVRVAGQFNGDLHNAGSLIAGDAADTNGATTLNGTFEQDSTGTLLIEIGGSASDSFDALNVSGTATLGGDLNVSLLDNFVPSPSDVFHVIFASSLAGVFANAPSTIDFAGGQFDVSYGANGITLSNFAAVPEPASVALLVAPLLMIRRKRRRR